MIIALIPASKWLYTPCCRQKVGVDEVRQAIWCQLFSVHRVPSTQIAVVLVRL
jgi:hypothetical protein